MKSDKLSQVSWATGTASSRDNSEPTTDSAVETSGHGRKADLDNWLAQWHLKFIKQYKNEHDEGLTYISPHGAIPLTPAIICDWYLDNGQATIAIPPNIPLFDPAVTHSPSSSVDINSLTSVLLLQTLSQSGLLTGQLQSPQTPTWDQEATTSSPPIPFPTSLTCYLQHAQMNLGVQYALSYKYSLELHRIRPDILPDVSNKLLSDLGISAGNKYYNRGSCQFSGPPIQRDDDADIGLLRQWFPVPHRYGYYEER
ncbi:hypothetical protein V8B97DRAFT_2026359 [Scleroderma yunnanense]